ncbi:type VI secretion system tube protein Hcp [Aquisalimonas lutea]|uniref:Hcp family type VI secretion system effector n=1 Tax=Aquisalimonas lutea TaxID=1327750 RepID=UPI0025B5F57A|nr:type VI secretion system tube protein Hcp [Aquisalimonas lutea]MDN3519151.1 type VI secretion system tube protein Hcp [Aquisalimonas lutea]
MSYKGIKGESSDKNHKEWIDIDDLHWGVKRNITSNTSTQNDRESANAVIQDLTLARRMDSASPNLFIESCSGKGKTIVLHLTKTGTGTGSDAFMEYALKNALISSYEMNAETEADERPTELLTISFVDLEMKYTPYDQDGNAMAPVAVGFDTSTGEKR